LNAKNERKIQINLFKTKKSRIQALQKVRAEKKVPEMPREKVS
jgi:hypothetical protein